MGWKDWSYIKKGGLIGAGIGLLTGSALIFLFSTFYVSHCGIFAVGSIGDLGANLVSDSFLCKIIDFLFIRLSSLYTLLTHILSGIIVGALIGLVIGKIKSK